MNTPHKKSSPDRLAQSARDASGVPSLFPSLRQPYLRSVRICTCFCLDDAALPTGTDNRKPETLETKFVSEKGNAWIRVQSSPRHDSPKAEAKEWRLAIECAIESMFPPSQANLTPPNTIEEVQKLLVRYSQQKARVACCEGWFLIQHDKLPKRGFIDLMVDISASAGKAELNLTGASFDIQGCVPFDEVRWRRRIIKGKNHKEHSEIEVALLASPDIDGIGGCVEDVADILSSGIHDIVMKTGV
jgi:hypothetical protein